MEAISGDYAIYNLLYPEIFVPNRFKCQLSSLCSAGLNPIVAFKTRDPNERKGKRFCKVIV